jgi:colicin import membrane protein
MSLDLPKFIRAEAERAEMFAKLVERADELGRWEQTIADAAKRVDALKKQAEAAEKAIATAESQARAIVADAVNASADMERSAKAAVSEAQAEAAKIRDAAADAAKAAKAKENAAEAAEKKALDGIKAAEAKLATVTKSLADAEAVIARAAVISAAMKSAV